MKKAKIWKIGTKINSYVNEFIEYMDEYDLDIGDSIFVVMNKKKKNLITIRFGDESETEPFQRTKAQQMIKILLTFGFIESLSIEKFDNDDQILDSVNYKILSNSKNWRENFIEELGNFEYLNELNEEKEDKNKFIFSKHKDAIFSLLKAFEIYAENELDEYDQEDKKVLNYWVIKDLFVSFEEELKDLCDNILHPITTPVKQMKNLDLIQWSDFKIENLSEIKDKKLESDLWNLADVLSLEQNISIPIMQRKYVWSIELVEKLMNDINGLGQNKQFHYIGSIVYKEKDKNIRILDGQQRLTTLFLILAAINAVYSSESAHWDDITTPSYLKPLFPCYDKKSKKLLKDRFIRLAGNEDYHDFIEILAGSHKKIKEGTMWNNFSYILEKISKWFKESDDKQNMLDNIFKNTIERIAFTANKNQIENEYDIFEKLNTLSQPLTQIDLLKNYLLPFCKPEELDQREGEVQGEFEKSILGKINSEPTVTKFVNYFVALYENEYNLDKEIQNTNKKLRPFRKMASIIEQMYDLEKENTPFDDFLSMLKKFGEEIDDFKSITDRKEYTKEENKYHDYSDILLSFEKRFVYAPLIKRIFMIKGAEGLTSDTLKEREEVNKIRKILFEIERYELFFQVVLYRGQSMSGIIERITNKVIESGETLNHTKMRKILKDKEVITDNLIIPEISQFTNKVANEPMADKVSILILNRLKFYFNNGNSILLNSSFDYQFISNPSREHIMSQEIKDLKIKEAIFKNSKNTTDSKEYNSEEFNKLHKTHLEMIGNILMVKKSDNSQFGNKSSMLKLGDYIKKASYLEKDPSFIGFENTKTNPLSLKTLISMEELGFDKIKERSESIAEKLSEIYK